MEFAYEPMINFRTWKLGGGIWATKLNSTDSVDKAVWILRGLVKGLVKPLLNHTPDYTNKGKNTNKVCSFSGTRFHTAVHKRPNWPFVKWFHVNSVSFNWWWARRFQSHRSSSVSCSKKWDRNTGKGERSFICVFREIDGDAAPISQAGITVCCVMAGLLSIKIPPLVLIAMGGWFPKTQSHNLGRYQLIASYTTAQLTQLRNARRLSKLQESCLRYVVTV